MKIPSCAAGLVLGLLLDDLLGDPGRRHPVAAFGRFAGALERRTYRDARAAGTLFTAGAVVPLVAVAFAGERAVARYPGGRVALVAGATWAVLGGRSLRRAAWAVGDALERGDVPAAQDLLPTLCGRDPQSLGADGLARATIESVAENSSDAVVAPLFWGAIAGVPGLVGYRAINTLDAMVGHRSPRYARFGTASARLDDVVNYLPARVTGALTVAAAPLVGGDPRAAARAWRRDARQHPSPNAGVCEASAAGALGIRLGGRTVYGGRVEQRPDLGDGAIPTSADVRRAARLERAVQVAALVTCAAGAWAAAR